jgi:uncharacterized OB-fold protein
MSSGLGTAPEQNPTFQGSITLPYKLTTGRAASVFLAELANRRIVGTQCGSCGRVLVPAQDFCGTCGADTDTFVSVPAHGTVTAFTETKAGVLALVRLQGADTDLTHRILGRSAAELEIGDAVVVKWADDSQGAMLDIQGFEPGEGGEIGENGGVERFTPEADPIVEQPYRLELSYDHSYGPYYGRLFDEIATTRRIQGVRCPSCDCVLVPPREYCDVCFVRTGEWVDVADSGVLQAFSVIHLEFVGQLREPPYIYAEIVLDGSATRLIHVIGGISAEEAPKRLTPGARVRAVWTDAAPNGTLEDILHFELVETA